MYKKCNCCKGEKPITKFRYKHGSSKYGRFDECKECMEINFKNIIIKEQGEDSWNKYLFDRAKDRITSRTRAIFRRIKENKPTKTEKLLGCDWLQAKKHIESFFNDNLNWDNFHEWHIDHIEPLSSANNISELPPLCKIKNLQPLMAKDNIIKGGRRRTKRRKK